MKENWKMKDEKQTRRQETQLNTSNKRSAGMGFQLFGLIVAQEGQNIKTKEQNQDNPINQLSKNSGCWLSGYLLSEKMTTLQRFYSLVALIAHGMRRSQDIS